MALLGTPRCADGIFAELRDPAAIGHANSRLEDQIALLPSPTTSDTNGAGAHGDGGPDLRTAVALLPTPTRRDFKDTEIRREPHRPDDVDTLARALTDVLMPTPRATDGTKGGPNQRGSSGDLMLPSAVNLLPTPVTTDAKGARNSTANRSEGSTAAIGDTLGDVAYADRWGEYGPTIRRCEAVTRPAPEPTKLNTKGNPKLSDEFDEWLMMLPAGWITDVPGITWNEVLKACGNGVVPPQCVAALHYLRQVALA